MEIFFWWGRMELNHLPKRYEHPALTGELRPQDSTIIAYLYPLGYNNKYKICKK